jgi:hypothetical protein
MDISKMILMATLVQMKKAIRAISTITSQLIKILQLQLQVASNRSNNAQLVCYRRNTGTTEWSDMV